MRDYSSYSPAAARSLSLSQRPSIAPEDCAPAVRWQSAEQWLQMHRGTELRAPASAFALVSEVAVGRRKYALAEAEAEAEAGK